MNTQPTRTFERHRIPASVLGLFCLLLLLAGGGARASAQNVSLRFNRSIGELDGPLAFGSIAAVAAQDSLLAIADRHASEIVIYHTGTGRFVTRWGGRGAGPGEFQEIVAMAWSGDSLFVADRRGHAISVLGPDGNQIRAIRPDVGFVLRIDHLGLADDTTLIIGLSLPPSLIVRGLPREQAHAFIALADSRTGKVRARFFEDSERLSVNNELMAARNIMLCSARGDHRGTIAVLSPWRFDGTILRVSGADSNRIEFDREVPGFEPREEPAGNFHRQGRPSVVCGDDAAIFKWIHLRTRSAQPGGYLEVRGYSGDLLLQRTLTPADSGLFGTIGTAWGNRFYLAFNTTFEVPVVREYLLERVRR
jgi:hypothetical protein